MSTPRGRAIPVAAWWIEATIAKITADPRSDAQVGELLAKTLGRELGASKSTISRIRNRKPSTAITVEFAEAVSKFYDLPPPVFFPESKQESLDLLRTHQPYAKPVDRRERERIQALRDTPANEKSKRRAKSITVKQEMERIERVRPDRRVKK